MKEILLNGTWCIYGVFFFHAFPPWSNYQMGTIYMYTWSPEVLCLNALIQMKWFSIRLLMFFISPVMGEVYSDHNVCLSVRPQFKSSTSLKLLNRIWWNFCIFFITWCYCVPHNSFFIGFLIWEGSWVSNIFGIFFWR